MLHLFVITSKFKHNLNCIMLKQTCDEMSQMESSLLFALVGTHNSFINSKLFMTVKNMQGNKAAFILQTCS